MTGCHDLQAVQAMISAPACPGPGSHAGPAHAVLLTATRWQQSPTHSGAHCPTHRASPDQKPGVARGHAAPTSTDQPQAPELSPRSPGPQPQAPEP